jgi:RNA polymerase sigma-70 factor, ECF subfamily
VLSVSDQVGADAEPTEAPEQLEFAAFFEAHYVSVVRALSVLVGDDARAEELAEEAFARAYERWARVSLMDSPGETDRILLAPGLAFQ